jgi:hypothetical protein
MALDLTGEEKLVFMAELKRAISEALSRRIRMLHAVLDILEPRERRRRGEVHTRPACATDGVIDISPTVSEAPVTIPTALQNGSSGQETRKVGRTDIRTRR